MLSRGRSVAITILVIAAGAIGDSVVSAQTRVPSGPRIPAAAVATARTRGSVRVIVALNVAFTAESFLGVSGVQSQRASIARAQSAVLGQMLRTRLATVRRFSSIPYLALEVDEGDLQTLAASPDVIGMQLDAVAAPTLAESTSLIGATAAWTAGYTGTGSTVAIVDTGVDSSHPFLAGKVVSEACFSSTVPGRSTAMCPNFGETSTLPGSGGPCLLPGCEHGTHVAGIAAGKGATFSGVAPDASIISIQVFSSFDTAADCGNRPTPCLLSYTSDQILGLERIYALRSTYNIAAVNMSLGGGLFTSPCDSEPLKAIIDQLRTAGTATVIASGNDGSTTAMSSPACISTAISVASTTDGSFRAADQVSGFSNTNQYLSLLAPGETIFSSKPGGAFINLSGTSMAAPHVAGAWALMKSKRPSASVTEILSALRGSGEPITDPRNGLVFPRISVDAALALLPSPCDYTVSPSWITAGPQAGNVTIAVTAPVSCPWSATSPSPFVAVANEVRVGSGNVVLSYSENESSSSRSIVVTIAGTAVTITQRGLRPVHGDINGDGRADIVLQNLADGSLITWWLDGWNVTGAHSLSINQVSDKNWRVVGTGDLNADGNTDLVWRHETEGWLAVWFLVGTNVVSTQFLSINRVADLNWEIKGVGDINGDGTADLIWQHRSGGWLAAWLMSGQQVLSTTFLSIGQIPDRDWRIAGVGDVDADGYADLVWQHQSGGWLAVWCMRGTDAIATQLLSVSRITDTNWHIRGVGDVDGDNYADLVWQNDASGELGVWMLTGSQVINQRGLSTLSVSDLNWRIVGPG
jgi:subtilisin family serine protease